MARIAFALDSEEGHLLPTFPFAKALTQSGHEIAYFSLPNAEPMVVRQGFRFFPLLDGVTPFEMESFRYRLPMALAFNELLHGAGITGSVETFRPQLIITLSVFSLEAVLIASRYHVPVILQAAHWYPFTRTEAARKFVDEQLPLMEVAPDVLIRRMRDFGTPVSAVADISRLILDMPEIAFLPRAFAPLGSGTGENAYYVGSGIDQRRIDTTFDWQAIDGSRRLIYCSLGSLASLHPGMSDRFFRRVIAMGARREDWQVVVATGAGFGHLHTAPRPRGEPLVAEWLPQLQILQKAALFITHGGMGSVKEAICAGVPMVVTPVMSDQFDIADEVVRRSLGLRAATRTVTSEELERLVETVLDNSEIQDRVRHMQAEFQDTDMPLAISVVNRALNGERGYGRVQCTQSGN